MAEDTGPSLASQGPADRETDGRYLFPCTIVQRSCWFLEKMNPDTGANNVAVRSRLHGPLRVDVLHNAFRQVIHRHEVLRTRFVVADGEPKQLVEPDAPFPFPVVDLRGVSPEQQTLEADRWALEEAKQPFDLERGPLFRGRLLQTADEEHILLLTFHHLVGDGWSFGRIMYEAGELYGAFAEGRPDPLEPLPLQYADYACWEQDWLGSTAYQEELEFWRKRLDGYDPIVVPTDFPRPDRSSGRSDIRSRLLDRTLTDALKEVSDSQNATLFMTVLSAFFVTLMHETGQEDLTIRTQNAGRSQVELEPLVGWFVNPIALRIDMSGDPTFQELLQRVRGVVLDSLAHGEVVFEKVAEIVRPQQRLPRHPPFQVNFIFQRAFVQGWEHGGISMRPFPSKSPGSFADLNFFVVEWPQGWRISVDLSTDLFRPSTGDDILEKLEQVLAAATHNHRARLSDIRRTLAPRRDVQPFKPAPVDYVEPKTPMEKEVVALWEKVLGVSPVGLRSNFFDLGGHSMLAVRLLTQTQSQFGHQINLAQMFADPTVAGMVRTLSSPNEIPNADVIHIKPDGSRQPVIMIGGDHWFRPLAKRLGADQPMVGFSLARYEKRAEPTPFSEMGRDLADGILALQLRPPFILAGWCVDGVVAFEVAQHLIARGYEVSLVALLDAINPEYRRELEQASPIERIRRRTQAISQVAPNASASTQLVRGVLDISQSLVRKVFAQPAPAVAVPEEIAAMDRDRQEFRKLLYTAERQYTPSPISCPVLLIRSRIKPHQASDLGWKRVARGRFEIEEVKGDHIGMFREPDVQEMAGLLRKRLES